jgi:hypothetical protein
VLLLLGGAAAKVETFETRLSFVPEDVLTRDSLAGVGRAKATLVGDQLSISATYAGLPDHATVAELHQGVAVAARGPVLAKLEVSGGQSGTLSGTLKLTRAQAAALRAGHLYVQLNSDKAPDGHLWGWLLPPRPTAAQ